MAETMSATPWMMEQMTPDPDLPVETGPKIYPLPLRADELVYLHGLLGNEEGHGHLSDDGPDRRLFDKVNALVVIHLRAEAGAVATDAPLRRLTPAERHMLGLRSTERRTLHDYNLKGFSCAVRAEGQFEAEAAAARAMQCSHCGQSMSLRLFRRLNQYQLFAVCDCGQAEAL